MNSREDILNRIKAAIAPADAHEVRHRANAPQPRSIPREYRTVGDEDEATFLDRLAHHDATTHVVPASQLDRTVRALLGERKIVVPAGIPGAWIETTHTLHYDPPLDHDALDAADGVLTTCALAVAQTGTIVLDGGPGMGRRALTLLPDYHLCVVRADQLVASVPEAVNQLEDPTRPLTFISGPSATVDIEMTRVRGVHGPRRLEVIFVAETPDGAAT